VRALEEAAGLNRSNSVSPAAKVIASASELMGDIRKVPHLFQRKLLSIFCPPNAQFMVSLFDASPTDGDHWAAQEWVFIFASA
jgi:hypothetical protein